MIIKLRHSKIDILISVLITFQNQMKYPDMRLSFFRGLLKTNKEYFFMLMEKYFKNVKRATKHLNPRLLIHRNTDVHQVP